MNSLSSRWVAGVLLAAAVALPAAAQEALLADHKRWLEDVGPIITKVEREVFSALKTSSEREKFIRLFWRQRDPTPDTPENEFRTQYYERVASADETFGHGASKRGSLTDRGYHYLLLGQPLERHYFTTESQIWPCELWWYKGDQALGLPPYFYLLFFQDQGVGDYRLYYPGVDGPEKLIIPSMSKGGSGRNAAAEIVRKVNTELGYASLSYIPSDSSIGIASFGSTSLLASIQQVAQKKVSDSYARTYLAYKDFVETEHIDQYVGCAWQAKVLREGGQPFLHWSIEPDRMDVRPLDQDLFAAYELVLRLEDLKNRPVYESTQEIPLRLTRARVEESQRRRFSFQDLLPVVPGEFNLLVLLKNKTAGNFTSFQARLRVPAAAAGEASSLFLHHGGEAVPAGTPAGLRAFTFGGTHYLVAARGEYVPGEKLGAFVQADLSRPEARGGALLLEVVSVDGGAVAASTRRPLDGPGSTAEGVDVGPLDLSGVAPGYYRAEASLLSSAGAKLWTLKENFILLSAPAPVIPTVYARTHPPFPGPEHWLTLASQSFLTGDYEAARAGSERALKARDTPAARLTLGKSLYGLRRYRESLDVLAPLIPAPAPGAAAAAGWRDAAKVVALDRAALREWPEALAVLERLLQDATELGVLNLAAECQLRLGRPAEALALLRKSLTLDPAQPAVKAMESEALKQAGRAEPVR